MQRQGSVSVPILALLGALALLAAGCTRGKSIARENEALRIRIIELGKQIEQLDRRNAELSAELRSITVVDEEVPELVRAATPHPAEIKIGRLSHPRRDDREGAPHTLVVYLEPADGLGRFVQIVGDLAISASLTPPQGEAVTIGSVLVDPVQLREAYRSGLTGTHYTVAFPIELPPGVEPAAKQEQPCVISAAFIDGRTGRRLTAQRVIDLWR